MIAMAKCHVTVLGSTMIAMVVRDSSTPRAFMYTHAILLQDFFPTWYVILVLKKSANLLGIKGFLFSIVCL